MYQPGSHRRKVTQDLSSTFLLRCMPLFFSREGRWAFFSYFFSSFSEEKSQLPGFELTSQCVRRLRGYQLSYRGGRLCFRLLFPLIVVYFCFHALVEVCRCPSDLVLSSRPCTGLATTCILLGIRPDKNTTAIVPTALVNRTHRNFPNH